MGGDKGGAGFLRAAPGRSNPRPGTGPAEEQVALEMIAGTNQVQAPDDPILRLTPEILRIQGRVPVAGAEPMEGRAGLSQIFGHPRRFLDHHKLSNMSFFPRLPQGFSRALATPGRMTPPEVEIRVGLQKIP